MKSMWAVFVCMILALTAGATETILVEGSVPEDASIGLAGVQYEVVYDDVSRLVTFKGQGTSHADHCDLLFHAISVEDDSRKSITGYNGNCGHTPGGDVPMTDAGDGWLAFSINAADYTPNLGMFLTVVLRQDDARNLERFFGINSMMAPNDWANFDGSWTETDWSFNLVEDNTHKADQVPATAPGHFFKTPIYVAVTDDYTHTASAPKIEINVYELWIEYFRDAATSKDWKVVVGEDIAYKAIASADCKNWAWDMQDGVPDAWNPTGGIAQEGTTGSNPMQIPRTDLPRASNKWFGKKYGTVDVFCEDEEGNNHHFYSTSMRPSTKAEVFFPPDIGSVDPDAAVDTDNPPCWFKFWKDGNVVGKMNETRWCNNAGNLEAWGYYNPPDRKVYLCLRAATSSGGPTTIHRRSDGASYTIEGDGKHLRCVRETIAHEFYHKRVAETMTDDTPPRDTDELPAREESMPTAWHGSSFLSSDPDQENSWSDWPSPGGGSYDGYTDQEVRCRRAERTAGGWIDVFPDKDWSKDPENPKW